MILTKPKYLLTESFEDLEIKAFKSYDLELQADRLTAEFYLFQHKLSFLRHIFFCEKVNREQSHNLLQIFEKWLKESENVTDRAEILKITRPTRQEFLSLIASEI